MAPQLTKPRDIVRYVNALAVTFPVLRDEVNIADFFALEFLRINQIYTKPSGTMLHVLQAAIDEDSPQRSGQRNGNSTKLGRRNLMSRSGRASRP
jgi:hypothetical protein